MRMKTRMWIAMTMAMAMSDSEMKKNHNNNSGGRIRYRTIPNVCKKDISKRSIMRSKMHST